MSDTSGSAVVEQARQFDWLMSNFVTKTAGVLEAVGVSSDGLLIAVSKGLERSAAEQLAAIVSGLVSLGHGASRCFGMERLEQVVVEMDRGFLFVASISDGSTLGVLARRDADIGLVGYEMTLLVERAGAMLTPEIVSELKRKVLA
ncbi:MAG: roadblock/LC7 domain-containing protein [Actinomycetota bacterium]